MATLTIEEADKMLAFIPKNIFWKTQEALDKGLTYIDIPLDTLQRIYKKYKDYQSLVDEQDRCAELNNFGMAAERVGNIEDAIRIYEKNIILTRVFATHSFDRLLVIYRRMEDYVNEKRVCKAAISKFGKKTQYKQLAEKYRKRLITIQDKLSKQLKTSKQQEKNTNNQINNNHGQFQANYPEHF
ncbi:MAG: hypothetical protein LBL97_06310 [Prevotellaceae bacterium]|jgi:tetratricopeptide (TPR) repeat protein|nr:hypothetical protein [Prevotellaceae bacterium]